MTYALFRAVGTTAYIGPGAGIAFAGSFLALLAAAVAIVLALFRLPVRLLLSVFRRKSGAKRQFRRVIVLGFDGMDPGRARELMEEGKLPSFSRLADEGSFHELASTCPPMSPVAWSSFATGVNPGKHNVFDFINRDLRTYQPEMSSCRIRNDRPELLRKSRPFWALLGEHGVFSTVLRVPCTFPPEKHRGLSLSAMCVPDLRGTQGEFTVYRTGVSDDDPQPKGGVRIAVGFDDKGQAQTRLPGPNRHGRRLSAPIAITRSGNEAGATVTVSGRKFDLERGAYSDWVEVVFRDRGRKVEGICRFLLVSVEPEFCLYVTPINISPARPVMPVSWPHYYSVYLSKLHGPFATLGLAEDTGALDAGVIDDEQFLDQCHGIQEEREEMFFGALKRVRDGMCVCVFDLADRVQHMFHGRPVEEGRTDEIAEAYRRFDSVLGRVMDEAGAADLIIAMSDHGFTSFKWAVSINAWLREQGLLKLRPDAGDEPGLADIDWSSTKAYGLGLGGIYLNLRGRESDGIVERGDEERALKKEIADGLSSMTGPSGVCPVRQMYDTSSVYSGPYVENAPDLVVGFEKGFRVSWDSSVGKAGGPVLVPNDRKWAGDHCVDRDVVPGILFCNRKLSTRGRDPHIMDIAPTILEALGLEAPSYMDGKALGLSVEVTENDE